MAADNLAGLPIYIDIEDLKYLPETVIEEKKDDKFLSKSTNAFLFYTTPGRATIKIYDNKNTYVNIEEPIAQFGNVEILTHSLIKRQPEVKIIFNTTTGNIESIEN